MPSKCNYELVKQTVECEYGNLSVIPNSEHIVNRPVAWGDLHEMSALASAMNHAKEYAHYFVRERTDECLIDSTTWATQ